MNKDQIKGSATEAAGKLQRKLGQAIGNPKQQAKGTGKVIKGRAQQLAGDAKALAKDVSRKV